MRALCMVHIYPLRDYNRAPRSPIPYEEPARKTLDTVRWVADLQILRQARGKGLPDLPKSLSSGESTSQGVGFGVWGLGFGVWGLGFAVCGLGFGV